MFSLDCVTLIQLKLDKTLKKAKAFTASQHMMAKNGALMEEKSMEMHGINLAQL